MPRYVTKAASTLRRKAFRRLCHLALHASPFILHPFILYPSSFTPSSFTLSPLAAVFGRQWPRLPLPACFPHPDFLSH